MPNHLGTTTDRIGGSHSGIITSGSNLGTSQASPISARHAHHNIKEPVNVDFKTYLKVTVPALRAPEYEQVLSAHLFGRVHRMYVWFRLLEGRSDLYIEKGTTVLQGPSSHQITFTQPLREETTRVIAQRSAHMATIANLNVWDKTSSQWKQYCRAKSAGHPCVMPPPTAYLWGSYASLEQNATTGFSEELDFVDSLIDLQLRPYALDLIRKVAARSLTPVSALGLFLARLRTEIRDNQILTCKVAAGDLTPVSGLVRILTNLRNETRDKQITTLVKLVPVLRVHEATVDRIISQARSWTFFDQLTGIQLPKCHDAKGLRDKVYPLFNQLYQAQEKAHAQIASVLQDAEEDMTKGLARIPFNFREMFYLRLLQGSDPSVASAIAYVTSQGEEELRRKLVSRRRNAPLPPFTAADGAVQPAVLARVRAACLPILNELYTVQKEHWRQMFTVLRSHLGLSYKAVEAKLRASGMWHLSSASTMRRIQEDERGFEPHVAEQVAKHAFGVLPTTLAPTTIAAFS